MTKKSSVNFDDFGGMFQIGADTNSEGNIPTGHFKLDFGIHYGVNPEKVDLSQVEGYDPSATLGLPLGKMVEIFGEEGSGKSSLAYRVCGYAQKSEGTAIWIDAEQSFSSHLAEINGVDRDKLLYTDLNNKQDADKALTAEDILDAIIFACKKKTEEVEPYKNLKVIVVDSVANLTTKAREEADAEKNLVGDVARLMSENLRKVVNHVSKAQVLVIFINQLRDKIGVTFGSPESTPGGRTLKFLSSVRLKLKKVSGKDGDIYMPDSDGNAVLIGGHAWVSIEKNRFSKPYKDPTPGAYDRIKIPIYYEPYFPDIEEMIFDVAKQLKIIKPYKSEYRWKDAKLAIEGRQDFIKTVKFKGLLNSLLLQVIDTAREEGVILPPEIALKVIDLEDDLNKLRESGTSPIDLQSDNSNNQVESKTESKTEKQSEETESDGKEQKSTRRGRKSKSSKSSS